MALLICYLPHRRTRYLSGIKYSTAVKTDKVIIASQVRNGTVQLTVLYGKK